MSGAQRVLEVGLILCGAFAIFLFLALVSFNPADPSWSQTGYQGAIENAAGAIGAWFADALLFSFGFVAYAIPFGLAGLGYVMFRQPHKLIELDYLALGLRLIGLILTLVGASALASLNFSELYSFSAGGVVGDVISSSLLPYFNLIGTTLLLLTFLCTGLTLVTGISWVWLADKLGEWAIQATLWLLERSKALVARMRAGSDEPRERKKKRRKVKPLPSVDDDTAEEIFERREPELDLDITLTTDEDDYEPDLGLFGAAEKKSMKIARADAKPKAQVEAENEATDETPETDDATQGPIDPLPSIALLDKPAKTGNPLTPAELEQISQTVEAVLQDFGVEVKVANVQPGPVITRFELDLAPGVKVSKISIWIRILPARYPPFQCGLLRLFQANPMSASSYRIKAVRRCFSAMSSAVMLFNRPLRP